MTEIDWTESEESQRWTSLNTSIYWLKAIIFQGERVLVAGQQPVKHLNSDIYNNRSNMEEQFFLNACGKAVRWITPLKLDNPEWAELLRLEKDIKIVRDEREHDEDRYGLGNEPFDTSLSPHEHAAQGYIKNSGGHKFRMKPAMTDGAMKIICSMASTIRDGDRLLLGGVLDVSEVVKTAEGLMSALLTKQHESSDKLIGQDRPLNEESAKIAESYYIESRFEQ